MMEVVVALAAKSRPGAALIDNTGLYYHDPAKPPTNESGITNITRGGRLGSYFEFYAPNPRQAQAKYAISPDWGLYPDGVKYPAALPFMSYVLLDNGVSGSTCNTFVTTVTNHVQNAKTRITPLTTVAYGGTGDAYDIPLTQYAGGSVQQTSLSSDYIMLGMLLIANKFFGSILTDLPAAAAGLTERIPSPAYYASEFPKFTRFEVYNNVAHAPALPRATPKSTSVPRRCSTSESGTRRSPSQMADNCRPCTTTCKQRGPQCCRASP